MAISMLQHVEFTLWQAKVDLLQESSLQTGGSNRSGNDCHTQPSLCRSAHRLI